MEIANSKDIDEWIWHHAQVLGNRVDGVKNEDGLNIQWLDTVTEETIEIVYQCEHGRGITEYCEPCGRIHSN